MMQSIFHGEIVHIHNIEFEYVDIVQYYNGAMVFLSLKNCGMVQWCCAVMAKWCISIIMIF